MKSLQTRIAERDAVIEYLLQFVGVRGYWSDETSEWTGGDDPVFGFDCSGLMSEAFRSVGWLKSHERLSSGGFLERFKVAEVSEPPCAGDLLVYGAVGANGRHPYHVAMAISPLQLVEAGGVSRGIDTDVEAAVKNAFVRRRPINFRQSERIAILRVWEKVA